MLGISWKPTIMYIFLNISYFYFLIFFAAPSIHFGQLHFQISKNEQKITVFQAFAETENTKTIPIVELICLILQN